MWRKTIFGVALLFFAAAGLNRFPAARAERIDELRSKIAERNGQIAELEREIAAYETQIEKETATADTLKNQIERLESAVKKLNADIRLAERQISRTELTIDQFAIEIELKKQTISRRRAALASAIRSMDELETRSLVEILLSNNSLSEFFNTIDDLDQIRGTLGEDLENLRKLNEELGQKKALEEEEKNRLEHLKGGLSDRRFIEQQTKGAKNTLLAATKNREASYRNLLQERLEKREALEQEIQSIEEELRVVIDPSSLPRAGSGVLRWPLDEVKITQFFGNTAFATANPQVYSGKGHNGIDLRASIGTAVKASYEGTVKSVGDTDTRCAGVSYGKWVLIEHPNNLATLYAHLSRINVQAGQRINAGELIGYSGNTGYTTGPHLHFAVFAAQGVRVDQYRSRICGTMMTLPLAPYNSYLNPLSYL